MIPRHFKLHWQTGQWITSGAQLALLVIGAQTESPLGWSVCLGLMALLSLWAWSGALRRRRAITDTPTSRIASAAQGYVELQGNGRPMAGLPLVSPLSGGRCLWYRNTTEQKDSENQWKVINRDESEASFVLDDGSGLGQVLSTFAGYRAQPTAMLLLAYALYWGYVALRLRSFTPNPSSVRADSCQPTAAP